VFTLNVARGPPDVTYSRMLAEVNLPPNPKTNVTIINSPTFGTNTYDEVTLPGSFLPGPNVNPPNSNSLVFSATVSRGVGRTGGPSAAGGCMVVRCG
jgi:hypothetical protein